MKKVVWKSWVLPCEIEEGCTTEPSIFVFGFAFRSSLTFEQIRDFVQKRVNKSDKGWGIGAIAVLYDKDGRTGLITNVDPYLLGSIKVKSVRQDPIASIITKNEHCLDSFAASLFIFAGQYPTLPDHFFHLIYYNEC